MLLFVYVIRARARAKRTKTVQNTDRVGKLATKSHQTGRDELFRSKYHSNNTHSIRRCYKNVKVYHGYIITFSTGRRICSLHCGTTTADDDDDDDNDDNNGITLIRRQRNIILQ